MNIRDLKYLVAIADHGHFGKAAEACFVSQPALSMQVQKLEETLGVKLFERTNKKVMITDIGKEIAERARKIVQDIEDMKEIARASQDPFSGEIRLGAFPTLAPYFFPQVIPKITKTFPNLKLLLTEEKTEGLLEKLKKGDLDAAFLALPIEDDTLEAQRLFEDPFFLAVPKDHNLAKQKFIHQSELAGKELLLLEEGHCLRRQSLDVCDLMGLTDNQDFRATSMETLRQMVASGVGITLIPKLAFKKNDGLTYLPFKTDVPSRTIALVWHKTSPRRECFVEVGKLASELDL